jgi:hypothetical protein
MDPEDLREVIPLLKCVAETVRFGGFMKVWAMVVCSASHKPRG